MKDSLWGKEIRWSKIGERKYSTGTGAPAPEHTTLVHFIKWEFVILRCMTASTCINIHTDF